MDLLDHLIRLHQRPLRNRQADLLRRFEVSHQLKLHRLLNWQVIKFATHEFFRVVVAFWLGRGGVGRVPTVGSNQFCVIWL